MHSFLNLLGLDTKDQNGNDLASGAGVIDYQYPNIVKSQYGELFFPTYLQFAYEPTTGEEIYTARCSACHLDDFSGRVGPSLKMSNVLDKPDSYWLQTILKGKGSMPAVRITEEQAQLVIDYIRDSN